MANDQIKVYHYTSMFALKRINQTGQFGLTVDDYRQLAIRILQSMNTSEKKIEHYLKRVQADKNSISERFGASLGSSFGEGYGHFLKETVKYGARVNKLLYKEILPSYLPSENQDVRLFKYL